MSWHLIAVEEAVSNIPSRGAAYRFALYPNPASGELNLELSSYFGKGVRIKVYSSTVKLWHFAEVDEVQTPVERLDLQAFAPGVYLVKVKTAGAPDAVKRVIVR